MPDSTISLKCDNCDGPEFELPDHRPLLDDDVISFHGCKRTTTVGVARTLALESVKKFVADNIKNMFKRP